MEQVPSDSPEHVCDPYLIHGTRYGAHGLAEAKRVLAPRLEAAAAVRKSAEDAVEARLWATAIQVRRAVRILSAGPARSPENNKALADAKAWLVEHAPRQRPRVSAEVMATARASVGVWRPGVVVEPFYGP